MKYLNRKNTGFVCILVLLTVIIFSSSSSSSAQISDNNISENLTSDLFDYKDAKWSTTEVASIGTTLFANNPSIAIDSCGNMHVIWFGDDWTYGEIQYRRWDITSKSWNNILELSSESVYSVRDPVITTDIYDNIHVIWRDEAVGGWDIVYRFWNASTENWSSTEIISTESSGNAEIPRITSDIFGNIHVAWQDNSDYDSSGTDLDIFYKRWDTSLKAWTITEVVSTESTGKSERSSIDVDRTGNVHVSWTDWTADYAGSGSDNDIFYKQLDYFSKTWSVSEVVSTESTSVVQLSSLCVDYFGNVYVTWDDLSNYAGSGFDWDIFCKKRDVGLRTWSSAEVISIEGSSDSFLPFITADLEGSIHLFWYDSANYRNAGTDEDIFHRKWDVLMKTWSVTDVISTESTSPSIRVSATSDHRGLLYVVWQDNTNYLGAGTDPDIFFKYFSGPSDAPELATIVPNLSENGIVELIWDGSFRAIKFYVYRSNSYIWTIEQMSPYVTVIENHFTDSITMNDEYYYVVVADNNLSNSTHSNCEYVEVNIPSIQPPELAIVIPNPSDISNIFLDWGDVIGATEYYIYRSSSYIWSVDSLTPLTTVVDSDYIDSLPSEDYYFYVIVATDGLTNSTLSNCEYVEYRPPTLFEYLFPIGLTISLACIVTFAIFLRRRKSS